MSQNGCLFASKACFTENWETINVTGRQVTLCYYSDNVGAQYNVPLSTVHDCQRFADACCMVNSSVGQ